MTQRYVDETDEFFIEEDKVSKLNSLRQETELFDDESYIPHPIVNVKRINLPSGEDWEIVQNKQPVLILKGVRFTKLEREFFRTPQGMLFIINGYKQGWKSVSEFKRKVKKCLR